MPDAEKPGAEKSPAKSRAPKKGPPKKRVAAKATQPKFPRHSVTKALRIPRAILEQGGGKPCSPNDAARFAGMGMSGALAVEIASALKYGFLERPEPGKIQPTQLARKILRPQSPSDEVEGFREAVLNAPELSEIYQHYRGENLPDDQFIQNVAREVYKIPEDAFLDFKSVFLESLQSAQLLVKSGDRWRVVDVTSADTPAQVDHIKKLVKSASPDATDVCFVMQPFSAPLGDYYEKIYKPAIEKAGLRPLRADGDLFHTGKIIEQVWQGIHSAKVLVAELTTRNPNVFYELGLAHALGKPVVLVSAGEDDVPFDLRHIRVIFYDVRDPFWGNKLMEKVAENVLSALSNPQEATFKGSAG
jgi:hypothetical protein